MRLPQDLNFATTIHGLNERIPTDATRYGTEAIYLLLILDGRGTDGPSSQA